MQKQYKYNCYKLLRILILTNSDINNLLTTITKTHLQLELDR